MNPLQSLALNQASSYNAFGLPANSEVSGKPGNLLQSFENLLNGKIQEINATQQEAAQAVETLATGGDIPIHQVMIASERAGLSLELATQVRNKLVSAYQEISHMQF